MQANEDHEAAARRIVTTYAAKWASNRPNIGNPDFYKSPPGRPDDRRCVFFGWLLVIIIVVIVLAVIGLRSLMRGRA